MSEDTTITTSSESAPASDALVVAPAVRKLPMRLKELELDDDFKGWKFTARMDIPVGALTDFMAADVVKAVHAVGMVLKAWNFVDEDGADWPPPSQETVGLMPQSLLTAVIERYMRALAELPKG